MTLMDEPIARTPRPKRQMNLPVGTIRIHAGVRRIKIRMDGPPAGRWMDYARWWWQNNVGPVPQGKRVCHADGNSLNDNPVNFALMTPGDVVFLWHDRHPKGSARNYEKCRAATIQMNRERAMCRRYREWLPSKWYPVDLSQRIIFNAPTRKRWQVFRDFGINISRGGNGRASFGCPVIPVRGIELSDQRFAGFEKRLP